MPLRRTDVLMAAAAGMCLMDVHHHKLVPPPPPPGPRGQRVIPSRDQSAQVKGHLRNEVCPCGSGKKRKKCPCGGHGIPPVHKLTEDRYGEAVRTILAERHGQDRADLMMCEYLASHVGGYWRSEVVDPASCAFYLDQMWAEDQRVWGTTSTGE